ncbi:hypothetical protein NQ318_000636 [Aromia moschata]|uniref:C2H2-type domain-containing protein n=1 Tax=Aromia moschata TaxID=1265417 RepID=A0AAV8XAU9_9CUCU|nr:hypothetical protein NQ318_000636 [Aromia moschata]
MEEDGCERRNGKEILLQHMRTHKDDSEVTTYDCHFCSYKAKHKSNFNRHMLIHKDASELTTYRCALCPYNSKRKADLVRHRRFTMRRMCPRKRNEA